MGKHRRVVENDLNTKKVAVDYEGNVYLSGTFEGSNLQVDGASLPDSLFQNNYNQNTYISKYSASGDFQWIRIIKNTSGFYEFKFNKANELILLCHATKNFFINNIPFSFPEDKYLGSSFLAKLDKNGNLLKCILQNSPYRGLESISADRFCIMGRMDDFKTVEIFGTDTLAPANYLTERKFFVTVNPLPQPRLGNDTILAPDRFLVLFPGMFNSYLWHDGKTGMMNTIGLDVNTGTHTAWVKVTNEFGCENTDSITITFATVDVKNVEKNTIYVYPVPAREYITINTSLEIDRIEYLRLYAFIPIKQC